MYCDHIFIQILHDKRLLRTMKSPHREEKKKVDDIFFSFFTMKTRNTPLSLHYSVTSAPGVALLQAGLQMLQDNLFITRHTVNDL